MNVEKIEIPKGVSCRKPGDLRFFMETIGSTYGVFEVLVSTYVEQPWFSCGDILSF